MRHGVELAGVVHRFLLAQEFRLLALMLVLAPVPWLIDYGQDHALFADRRVLEGIRSDGGLAAWVRIPDDVRPAIAERGYRVCEGRSVLGLEFLRAPRIGYFVVHRVRWRFPEFDPLLFRCFDASLGARLHEDIRRVGGGFYDNDGERLRFSGSDGSNPAGNGRVYLISIPWGRGAGGAATTGARALVETACRAPVALCAWVLVRKRMWPWIRQRYRGDTRFDAVAASVVSTGIVLLVAAVLMEAYLRWRIPFTETEWPAHRFDPESGFVYSPNTRVRWTNHVDFWVEQTSNSLGFLDREPVVPKPDGMFRVLVIGDSFVEAAQVRPAEKMHVVLEARLRDALDTDMVDTVALGRSGTGQSSQLVWYDRYGADIDADLVVLLFVSNDFTDNSALLQGVVHGWDPRRPPMLFHAPDESGLTFTRVGIDPDWMSHVLRPPHARPDQELHQQVIMERYPETRAMFGDWLLPDVYPDCVFYADELPPVFSRALASTEHALRLFRERTENSGTALLLVTTHGVVSNWTWRCDAVKVSRSRDPLNQLRRITGIAGRVGIPVLDLYPAFAERGDWRDTQFAYDSHWNALGHRQAAEEIADHLLEHRELLTVAPES